MYPKPDFLCLFSSHILPPSFGQGWGKSQDFYYFVFAFVYGVKGEWWICVIFFSLRSPHASFYWLRMHEHLCATCTIYVCIYAQWMHTTQGPGQPRTDIPLPAAPTRAFRQRNLCLFIKTLLGRFPSLPSQWFLTLISPPPINKFSFLFWNTYPRAPLHCWALSLR